MVEYLTSPEPGWFVGWPFWLAHAVVALLKIALLIQVPAVGALIFIWMERKIAGRIQDRLGPTRVGGAFGWLQTLADGIKLIAKEDITPGEADRMLFKLAPYIGFAASLATLLAIPFSANWVAVDINIGIFFVLAVLGLEVFSPILAGYASGSKWSLFGAMREAAQVVSYEVPLGLCVVVPVMICGTMNLTTIGEMQDGGPHNWLVFHDPFTFVVAIVYFTCATASVNRAPFDLAEAESELVAGFHTEYSGLRWSYFFMAEYGSMFVVSALAAILFFGGWNGPIPVGAMLGLNYDNHFLLGVLGDFLGVNCLLLKSLIGVTVMMWVRWTLPRLRIDQVITTCLKYCVPLAAVCFVGVIGWQFADLPSPNDIDASIIQDYRANNPGEKLPSHYRFLNRPRSEIRERWAEKAVASLQDEAAQQKEDAGAKAEPAEGESPAESDAESNSEVDQASSQPATSTFASGGAE